MKEDKRTRAELLIALDAGEAVRFDLSERLEKLHTERDAMEKTHASHVAIYERRLKDAGAENNQLRDAVHRLELELSHLRGRFHQIESQLPPLEYPNAPSIVPRSEFDAVLGRVATTYAAEPAAQRYDYRGADGSNAGPTPWYRRAR